MIALALRVGPFVVTFDLNRADDIAVEDDEDEPELLFHGETVEHPDPRLLVT